MVTACMLVLCCLIKLSVLLLLTLVHGVRQCGGGECLILHAGGMPMSHR